MTSPAPESCNPTTEDHPKVPAARSPTLRGHRPSKILGQPKHATGGTSSHGSQSDLSLWFRLLIVKQLDEESPDGAELLKRHLAILFSRSSSSSSNKITVVIFVIFGLFSNISIQASIEYQLNSSLVQVTSKNKNARKQKNHCRHCRHFRHEVAQT